MHTSAEPWQGLQWIDESDIHSDMRLLAAAIYERTGCAWSWPEGDWRLIAAERRAAAACAAAERRAIRDVLDALSAAGVPALLLKGAALAYTIYPEPWLRPHGDVDVLVPPGRASRIEQTLTSLGYERQIEISHPLLTTQSHFVAKGPLGVALDVHETLVNPYVLRSLPAYDDLVLRSRPVPALGLSARALGTPDALLHALVHRVAHHNCSVDRLWLYDMKLMAERMTEDDWEVLVSTAASARVCAIAMDGLDLLNGTAGTTVPAWVRARLGGVRGEPSASLLGGGLTELRLQWINFRSLPDTRARASFLLGHLMPPQTQLAGDHVATWRAPARYLTRFARGLSKWLAPISRQR